MDVSVAVERKVNDHVLVRLDDLYAFQFPTEYLGLMIERLIELRRTLGPEAASEHEKLREALVEATCSCDTLRYDDVDEHEQDSCWYIRTLKRHGLLGESK